MKLNIVDLMAMGMPAQAAEKYVHHFARCQEKFEIDNPNRIAAFLAQAAVESANFNRMEEGLNYRTPQRIVAMFGSERVGGLRGAQRLVGNPKMLANLVYANRYLNGDIESGDGWKYRGRGWFQLTFKDNYQRCGEAIGVDLVEDPDLVRDDPQIAVLSAGWYWGSKRLNALADTGMIDVITKKINAAMEKADERRERYNANLRTLSPF